MGIGQSSCVPLQPPMANIPEEDTTPAGGFSTTKPGPTMTIQNVKQHESRMSMNMPKKNGGVRSVAARTENLSTFSCFSSISTMSNFFKVTEAPFGGLIPAKILRQEMQKRQEQLMNNEGATDQPNEQTKDQ